MKFLHAADIHLDSPLRGLERYEGAPIGDIRGATRRALENLVGTAEDEKVDFIVIAGDVYDGDWKDYNTGLFFAGQMSRLRAADIPVFMISGNHDAASQISKSLRLPDNVRQFTDNSPETETIDNLGVAIHAHGYASRDVSDDLSAAYPPPVLNYFNIGILHTSANGREGHDRYAPCTVGSLVSKGYQYWALGHVHTREVLCQDPPIVFPGNLQGRSVRESGPRGCTLVRVSDGELFLDPIELDVVRWVRLVVDVTGASTGTEVVDRVRCGLEKEIRGAGDRLLAVRIIVRGRCVAHGELWDDQDRWTNEVRASANDLDHLGRCWIEKVLLETETMLDMDDLRARVDALGELLRSLELLRGNESEQRHLLGAFRKLNDRLPQEVREECGIDLDNPHTIRDVLDGVEDLLLSRLAGAGGVL